MLKSEEYEYFRRSKLAYPVLKTISKQKSSAKPISKNLKTYRESISRVFKKLKELNLAECNDQKSNYRDYKITNRGKFVLKDLEENNFYS
jgi:predicted transcriptional regulator